MSGRRYTLRITRKVKWLEDLIEQVEERDRSDFMRALMEDGCRFRGIHPLCSKSDNYQTVVRQQNVSQTADESQTIVSELSDNPTFDLKITKTEEDWESKLDSMYKTPL